MATTTQDVITDSFYLSQILARGYETLDPEMLSDGLNRLNGFIALKSVEKRMISYYSVYNGFFVPGQEEYYIENLVEVDSITFQLNTIRFNMREYSRYDYFATARANFIQTLPYSWHSERALNGTNFWVYFLPNQPYPFQIIGKFQLTEVFFNQDLALIFDKFYIEYLKYGLAEYLCGYYTVDVPTHVIETLKKMNKSVRDTSPIDFTLTKQSFFSAETYINYAAVSLSPGWTRRNGY